MSTGTRGRVLSLYRQILRTGRRWEGSEEEQHYISTEARRQFRANQQTSQIADRDKQILEAELRLQYAVQYKIPYPRLEHKTQYKSRPKPQQNFGKEQETGRTPAGEKLAQAMQRRRQAQHDRPT